MLQHWWVWAVLAAILAAIEALAPGWVFLGLALGAGALALTLLIGGPRGAACARQRSRRSDGALRSQSGAGRRCFRSGDVITAARKASGLKVVLNIRGSSNGGDAANLPRTPLGQCVAGHNRGGGGTAVELTACSGFVGIVAPL